MVITKREDITKQVSVKQSEENSVFGEVSYKYLFNSFFLLWGGGREKAVGAYLSLSGNGRELGLGWELIRGWVLINCSCLNTEWALIRGWAALIRIHTVAVLKQTTLFYFSKK